MEVFNIFAPFKSFSLAQGEGSGSPVVIEYWLLEDDVSDWLLEDGTSKWLLE